MILITVPVFLWGCRLSGYIAIRKGGEDYRYKQMRENWEKSGTVGYYIKAYMFVYIMQGVFSFVNNSSVLYVNLTSTAASPDV